MSIEENFEGLCSLSIGKPIFEHIPIDGDSQKIRILQFPLQDASPSEVPASFKSLEKYYGQKLPFNFEGEILYGELAALRHLQKHGWEGVWVDSYQGRGKKLFWKSMPIFDDGIPKGNIELETEYPEANRVYEAIRSKNTNQKKSDTDGFFDILAWKNGDFTFLEFKKKHEKNKEPLTSSQKLWVQAVRSAKVDVEKQLFIVSRA